MTEVIIKEAVQNCGYVLQYVPKDKITDEIIKLAVQNNALALQYVPKDRRNI
jgi:hypothetical protein